MGYGVLRYYFLFYIILFIVIPISYAKIVVVNSQNWDDVYIGLLYGQKLGHSTYFLNNPNPQSLLRSLPMNQDVLLIESENPFYSGLDSLLRSKGLVVDKINVKDSSLELFSNISAENIYLVPKDFPYVATIITPLALSTNGWVFIVDEKNVNEVVKHLDKGNVISIGYFPRNVRNIIKEYVKKEIIETNKFKLSLLIAEEVLKIKDSSQVTMTDGRYIEKEFFLSQNPILLVGTNLLPEETTNWLINKKIKSVVLIGTHLTYIGEQVRSNSNKTIGVFIKYGEAIPGSPVYALTMMPLPFGDIKLSVDSLIYDPISKHLVMTIRNNGSSGGFIFVTGKVSVDGVEIASIEDKEPRFIGAESILTNRYSLSLSGEDINKNLIAELYISYGEMPETLDSFLTSEGKFGPPLSKKIDVMEIEDRSSIEIKSLSYYVNNKRLVIEINNTGDVDTYVIVKIPKIIVGGVNKALSSNIYKISKGESKNIWFNVELDEFDIQENKELKLVVSYGEREALLVKSIETTMSLNVISGIDITGMIIGSFKNPIVSVSVIILVVVIIAAFSKRWKKTNEKFESSITQQLQQNS